MAIAWLAGPAIATVSMIAGLGAVKWYFLPPAQGYTNLLHIVTYLFVSGAAVLMSAAYHRRSRQYAQELRQREAMGRELSSERDALQQAEEKFRGLAETGSSAIFIHDGTNLVYVNKAAEELLEYTREELLGLPIWNISHPDYTPLLQDRAAARMRGESVPNRYEFKIISKSGKERWLDIGAQLITFDRKPCIVVNAFDISNRKSMEAALRDREEHYRAAIEAGKVGTWEWDLEKNRIVFSENWYSHTSTIERTYETDINGVTSVDFRNWRESIHKEDRPKVDAAIEASIKHDSKYEVEYRVHQKGTKEVRWFAALGRVLRDDQGDPLRMIGAAVDLTDRHRAEETLLKTEKLAAAGRLAASIAHEVNNPLEAVTNLIFLARQTGTVNVNGERLLDMAEEELKRATHLTKQTLGFYRDSTFPTRFTVPRVIDEVLSLYAGRTNARGITVQKEYADSGEMHGMIGEIRQVISNLLANAVDAMPFGGTLYVRLRRTMNSKNGSALRITVADTGSGIPAELQTKIFEPFFTTKTETGTGLGLWLTKNILEKHRGTICVSSSNTGKTGTVFVLTIPASDVRVEPLSTAA